MEGFLLCTQGIESVASLDTSTFGFEFLQQFFHDAALAGFFFVVKCRNINIWVCLMSRLLQSVIDIMSILFFM